MNVFLAVDAYRQLTIGIALLQMSFRDRSVRTVFMSEAVILTDTA